MKTAIQKNYKQTCSKQKIANVSSVNECLEIDTSSRVRKTEHMRSRQNVPGRSKRRPNREIACHAVRLLLHVRYTNSKRSPSSNANLLIFIIIIIIIISTLNYYCYYHYYYYYIIPFLILISFFLVISKLSVLH